MRTASLIAVLSFLSVGCADAAPAPATTLDDGAQARTIADDSADSVIVLYLANSLDQDTLDDDATLDSRAAANIVSYRNGSDGIEGTSDDEVIDDLDEFDAISYVGDSAMADLLDYGTDVIGLTGEDVHGVLINSIEAESILFLANHLSQDNLDNAVSLDSRAATNIASDRGFAGFDSLDELDDAGYVGARAFGKLLDFADDEGMLDDEGAVIRDGEIYTTLQDAVDATASSITIRMFAGTYTGGADIDSTLIVKGYGTDRTVLDGQDTHQILVIDGGSPCFYDMTLTAGAGYFGGAVSITNGTSIVFDSVDFIDNASSYAGGAVFATNRVGQVVIRDALISGNTSVTIGGAITIYGDLTLTDSTVTDNHSNLAAGVYTTGAVVIEDTSVTYNTGLDADRGALTLRNYDITVSNVDFYANTDTDLVLRWDVTTYDGLGDGVSVTCDSVGCTGL